MPYGVGIIEPVRVEVGMIVTGYDYDEHERTPYDLGMDRMVALDAEGRFMGKEKLREVAADPPNRFKTMRLEGGALTTRREWTDIRDVLRAAVQRPHHRHERPSLQRGGRQGQRRLGHTARHEQRAQRRVDARAHGG